MLQATKPSRDRKGAVAWRPRSLRDIAHNPSSLAALRPATFLALALAIATAACQTTRPPYPPQEALDTFQIEEGFRIELFASEPDVVDPVAMEFDEFGRVYVVENSGYPLNTEGKVGRVKLLQDLDGDGHSDRTTVFVDELTMPTGVMAWKNGILVTDAPNVWYFEDQDDDGRADVRTVMLAGFPFNNPQHTVSSPYYGLDNWIYLSHEGYGRSTVFGDKFNNPGSEIHFPAHPDAPRLPIEGRSLRFRPDTREIEYLTNRSQFGMAFDRWGRLFVHNNSNHVQHEVIASRYLSRNKHLFVRRPWEDVSDHGNAAEVFPITVRPRFEILSNVGQFTSACGLTLYLGGEFPAGFDKVSFVAEPVHNLVHRDVLEPRGVTFTARRAHEEREFLASTDRWFRPVNLYTGPDGALYVLDYYREVIEHPEWTSAETYLSDELYDGDNYGRIYRIVPEGGLPRVTSRLSQRKLNGQLAAGRAQGPAPTVSLGTPTQLAATLANPNIWWRRTAQRLLVDRQSVDAVAALRELVEESSSPEARVHALWTLDGLDRLDAALISLALDDPEPGVRENAVLLAEKRLDSAPLLAARILAMENDPDPRVRFQVLATLGEVDSPAAPAVRDRLLFEGIEDSWMQVAGLSWRSVQPAALFRKATGRGGLTGEETAPRAQFFERVAGMMAAAGKGTDLEFLLSAIASQRGRGIWWREASLKGLAQGITADSLDVPHQKLVLGLFDSEHASLRRAALEVLGASELEKNEILGSAVAKAAIAAGDTDVDPEHRVDAIRLLALADPEPHQMLFKSLLGIGVPEDVQAEAVRALGEIDEDHVPAFLLENWRNFTGEVRAATGEGMARTDARLAMVVDALDRGDIQAWTLPHTVRHRLIMHKDAELRERARGLIERPEAERRDVLARYEAALEMEGDVTQGQATYEEHCSKCHQLNGAGKDVGPDLATVRSRPAQHILTDILAPSRAIEPEYESYVVETTDGRTLDGVLGPQTPTSITLRREDGVEDVVPRSQIKRMYATELSAMPDDLDKEITVEEMAGLIRYVKTAKPSPEYQ